MAYKTNFIFLPDVSVICVAFSLVVVGCQNENQHQEAIGKFSATSATSVQSPPPSTPSAPPPAGPPVSPPPSSLFPKSPPPSVPSPPPAKAVPLPAEYYDWKQNEFKYQDVYSNRCVFPTSSDHKKGTMLDELFAWRDIIYQNYEFTADVIDIDPRDYVVSTNTFEEHFEAMTNSDSYVQKLRSLALDNTGKRIHGLYPASIEGNLAKELESQNSKYTYGIEWENISNDIPRDYKVRYTDPDSPAAQLAHGSPVVKRGDRLLKVNDFDFVNETVSGNLKSVNELLVPKNLADTTRFVFRDRDTREEKVVYLRGTTTKLDFHNRTIHHTSIIKTETGNVGYLHLGKYGVDLTRFHKRVKNFEKNEINDIIVDLRYFDEAETDWRDTRNEASFAYMILGLDKTVKGPYNTRMGSDPYVYRDIYRTYRNVGNLNVPVTVRLTWTPLFNQYTVYFNSFCPEMRFLKPTVEHRYCENFWEPIWTSIPPFLTLLDYNWIYFESLNLDKVYVIASRHSCNRAELFVNAFRGIDADIVLIGENTCGDPFHRTYFHNCGISIELIDGRYYNQKLFTRYERGFRPENSKSKEGVSIPGCYVEDDLSKSIGNTEEPMLKAALQYRKDKTCPPVP